MPILKYWDIDGMSLAAFASSSLFEAKSAQWRRKPLSRHGILRFDKIKEENWFTKLINIKTC